MTTSKKIDPLAEFLAARNAEDFARHQEAAAAALADAEASTNPAERQRIFIDRVRSDALLADDAGLAAAVETLTKDLGQMIARFADRLDIRDQQHRDVAAECLALGLVSGDDPVHRRSTDMGAGLVIDGRTILPGSARDWQRRVERAVRDETAALRRNRQAQS